MSILVPSHLDEHLADFAWPLPAEHTIHAELGPGTPWTRIAGVQRELASAVERAAREAPRVTVVAGDCLSSLAVVAGLQRAGLDPAIVWLDAHGDVQTVETSTSGYLAGMPIRMLVGYGRSYLAEPLALRVIPEERVLLVGARDLDPPEAEYLATSGIRRCNVEELTPELLPEGPIYLHFDVDVIDPPDLPALKFLAKDGPTAGTVAASLRRVMDTGRVAALNIACNWHPHRGGAATLRDTVLSALAPFVDGAR